MEAYLQHYSVIDPGISGEVPVSPNVFYELSYLYNRFWLVRALFKTCPDFGRGDVEEAYHQLESEIQAYQASLPSEPNKIEEFTEETETLLEGLHEINNRQAFYTQVVAAAKTEPKKGRNFDADEGVVRWGYGFQRGNMPGVEILAVNDGVSAKPPWVGTHSHVFSYRDTIKVIVGWDLVCNRNDGHNGDWHKVSEQIIGQNSGDVYVKADYGRAYGWSIIWYVVDANLYPPGPWTVDLIHAPGLSQVVDPDGAIEYWTPERMSAARPIDLPATTPFDLPEAGQSIVGGDAALLRRTPPPIEHQTWRWPPDTSEVPNPEEFPHCAVGKLFMVFGTDKLTGSASVVNGRGIMTAAHCVFRDGTKASQVMFVPAYQGNKKAPSDEPFGKWEIDKEKIEKDSRYVKNKADYDLAFCTVKPNQNGQHVGTVTGTLAIDPFDRSVKSWTGMGFPGDEPYDGQKLWRCKGDMVPNLGVLTKEDNLTKGASGGPWFAGSTTDRVNGLYATGADDRKSACSPKFDSWVVALYKKAFP